VATEATEVSAISFRANWQPLLTVSVYYLDIATDANFTRFLPDYRSREIIGNTLVINDLEVGQTYFYRVSGKVGNTTTDFSNTIRVTTDASAFGAVTALFPPQITLESFLAQWRAVPSASAYAVDVATDIDFNNILPNYRQIETRNIELLIDRLQPNTTYYYRVRAKRGTFLSSSSNVISLRTGLLDRPIAAIATEVNLNSFQANWSRVEVADDYLLDVAEDVNFQRFLQDYNALPVRELNRAVRNLRPDTNYFYRVRARKGTFLSEYSNVMSVSTNDLGVPLANPATEVTLTSFRANWRSADTNEQFRITVATDQEFNNALPLFNGVTVRGNSLAITGLRPNTIYYYRIQLIRDGFTSNPSNIVGVTTRALEPPVATSATEVEFTTFRANWEAVADAESYFIDVAEDFEFRRILSEYNNIEARDLFRQIRNLEVGKTYYYRVRARRGEFLSGNSNVSSVNTKSLTGISALPATNITISRFRANWQELEGADFYIVEVSEVADFRTFVSGFSGLRITSTSVDVTGLDAGKTYYYRVRGVRGSVTTPNSNIVLVTTRNFSPPVALAANNVSFTSFRANWEAVVGATTYLLEVSTDISFNTLIGEYSPKELVGTSENVTGLLPQRTYYYRLRARGAGGTSAYSNIITVVTNTLSPPTALDATNLTLTGFTANWQAATGATSYLLEIATDATFNNKITGYNPNKELVSTTEIVINLLPQTTYYYRLQSRIAGITSSYSNTIAVVTSSLGVPVATSASAVTLTSFTANWNASSGATSYLLSIATDAGFASFVTGFNDLELNVTSLTISGLVPNTNYFYKIKAKNGTIVSVPSNTISVTTSSIPIPVADPATNVSVLSFQANWQAVPSATSYFLDIATDAAFTNLVTGYNGKNIVGVFEVVSGLVPTATYYYRVRAQGLGSTSNNSNVINVTMLPLPPTVATAASTVQADRFTSNWNSIPEAASYLLDVATDNMFTNILPSYNGVEILTTNLAVTGLDIRRNHFYRVRTKRGAVSSVNSNTITASNGLNNGANVCRLTSYAQLPTVTNSIAFTYPSTTSFLPTLITNNELDIRFAITYLGMTSNISQVELRKNSAGNPLFQIWTFTYNMQGNVSSIRIDNSSSTFVEAWAFQYDMSNKVTSWRRFSDVMMSILIEERQYLYDLGQLNPTDILNATSAVQEYDFSYDTRINPLRLVNRDLAMLLSYRTLTVPTPATPDPLYRELRPYVSQNNVTAETYLPASMTPTTRNFIYTATGTKGMVNSRRLNPTTGNAGFTMTGCSF
jgi:phosphodiesterase/alkaline phosphatase D-like protein